MLSKLRVSLDSRGVKVKLHLLLSLWTEMSSIRFNWSSEPVVDQLCKRQSGGREGSAGNGSRISKTKIDLANNVSIVVKNGQKWSIHTLLCETDRSLGANEEILKVFVVSGLSAILVLHEVTEQLRAGHSGVVSEHVIPIE